MNPSPGEVALLRFGQQMIFRPHFRLEHRHIADLLGRVVDAECGGDEVNGQCGGRHSIDDGDLAFYLDAVDERYDCVEAALAEYPHKLFDGGIVCVYSLDWRRVGLRGLLDIAGE